MSSLPRACGPSAALAQGQQQQGISGEVALCLACRYNETHTNTVSKQDMRWGQGDWGRMVSWTAHELPMDNVRPLLVEQLLLPFAVCACRASSRYESCSSS